MLILINEHVLGTVDLSDGISIVCKKNDDPKCNNEILIRLTFNVGELSNKRMYTNDILIFKFPLIDSRYHQDEKNQIQKDVDLIESIVRLMAVQIEKSLYLTIIENKNNISIPDLVDDFIQSKINKNDIPIFKKYSRPLN